ncbi:MAG: ATP phosphoribosyltransferase [Sphingobacteriales bacterium SCN 48-20]|jgi:ATP phosphoribosyltransferase|uniref:ATP phosphoribosyltransferase n=1 Tax=Terrimonas ferruginea TaxID=249 RepID=UPI00040BC199|nr:ATP phosphoribosyltransferase [Terrimonas ferruginea]MBN8783825.1 ATP phosphoribosyltransferase [Terrimonas ferruginea]ODT93104.1 MAG: ATP phosphoribosyltransferase [Sphingobacteriales bacterium SCN 48-20]OJW40865.1 MAG: ATP phosphoribosyltransferase [Sphingobacteriales bacterium 48-107]
MEKKIRIAIQKSGRLHDDSMRLLKECGIDAGNSRNQLRVAATNFPAEIFFLRDDDIPEYVQDGVADIGFVGENVVLEKNKKVNTVEKLGFGKCRLSLAIPANKRIRSAEDLAGKKIATSYPHILSGYLKKKKIKADIHTISGSVEIAPRIGLADAICDLVSSGNTLFSNELTELETILQSEAVIISNNDLSPALQKILHKLLFRIQSVKRSRNNKYVLLNAPNEKLDAICGLLPGMRSPTVLPLAEPGWSSVHSVITETDFWNIIEQLKQQGAEGILVIPIEKMIL